MNCSYPLFLSPLVWLCRFRHRCGYGVHSPYAFQFITEVLYERGFYYAYRQLDRQLPLFVRLLGLRPRKLLRMFFRVVNYVHPRQACLLGADPLPLSYMQAAVPSASWIETLPSGPVGSPVDLLYVDLRSATPTTDEILGVLHSDSVLLLDHLRHDLPFWHRLLADPRVAITFDLYDVGILMFNKRLNRKDYIVNF